MRHQLRTGFYGIDKIAFEQFGDLAVILLAGTPEERLIGGVA
jgi:hypothetical protein